jgi:hypothetical protein
VIFLSRRSLQRRSLYRRLQQQRFRSSRHANCQTPIGSMHSTKLTRRTFPHVRSAATSATPNYFPATGGTPDAIQIPQTGEPEHFDCFDTLNESRKHFDLHNTPLDFMHFSGGYF